VDTILGAIIGGAITGFCTWCLTTDSQATTIKLLKEGLNDATKQRDALQKQNEDLKKKLTSTQNSLNSLEKEVRKFKQVRERLKKSGVVWTYQQPVVLVGPRYVGKTSLLMQWHAPWITSSLSPNVTHTTSKVPVYDFEAKDTEPHFADPELYVRVHTHLGLKVHDFPGETKAQQAIRDIVIDETEYLQTRARKNLGVVLICMFDAEEAKIGISKETQEYYNGELFRELRTLVTHSQVKLERLILVFNKYDLLKSHYPRMEDRDLLKFCVDKFNPIYSLLRGVCNSEKVCEVFTTLSREEMLFKNRGAPIVKGEASRAFVEAFTDEQTAERIIKGSATTYSAIRFGP
jgi:GTPase SAR1 family protein